MFTPGALAQLADVPASFDELAQGVIAGRFTNAGVASILTGVPMPESGAEPGLFGEYFLSAAAGVRVTYAPSSRFSIGMGLSGRRYEALPSGDTASSHLLQSSSSGTGDVRLGYSFSPRTEFQVGASTTRTFTKIQDTYATSVSVGLNRIMSRRWFVQTHVGTAFVTPVRQVVAWTRGPQVVGG